MMQILFIVNPRMLSPYILQTPHTSFCFVKLLEYYSWVYPYFSRVRNYLLGAAVRQDMPRPADCFSSHVPATCGVGGLTYIFPLPPLTMILLRSSIARTLTALQRQRLFSSSSNSRATWGFIGLGRMGYPMARNLRLKIPADDSLVIFDVNQSASKKFLEEMGSAASGGVVVADSVSDVAEKSVRFSLLIHFSV